MRLTHHHAATLELKAGGFLGGFIVDHDLDHRVVERMLAMPEDD